MLDRLLERGKKGNKRRDERKFRQTCKSFFPSRLTMLSSNKDATASQQMSTLDHKENIDG